jgi:hypothetical protein
MSTNDKEITDKLRSLIKSAQTLEAKAFLDGWLNNWDALEALIDEEAKERINTSDLPGNIDLSIKNLKEIKDRKLLIIAKWYATIGCYLFNGYVDRIGGDMRSAPISDEEFEPIMDCTITASRLFNLTEVPKETDRFHQRQELIAYLYFLKAELCDSKQLYPIAIDNYEKVIQILYNFDRPASNFIERGIAERARGRLAYLRKIFILRHNPESFLKHIKEIFELNKWPISGIDEEKGFLVISLKSGPGLKDQTLAVSLNSESQTVKFTLISCLENNLNNSADYAMAALLMTRNPYLKYGAWTFGNADRPPFKHCIVHEIPVTSITTELVTDLCETLVMEGDKALKEYIRVSSGG